MLHYVHRIINNAAVTFVFDQTARRKEADRTTKEAGHCRKEWSREKKKRERGKTSSPSYPMVICHTVLSLSKTASINHCLLELSVLKRVQGWHSGKSTFPPMCPEFDLLTARHMLVKFASTLPSPEGFLSLDTQVSPFPQKQVFSSWFCLIWGNCCREHAKCQTTRTNSPFPQKPVFSY